MATTFDRTDFLTTREASQRLGVSLSTVQEWVETGVLRAWKTPGGHRRIPVSQVEAMRTRQHEVLQEFQTSKRFVVLVVEDEEIQRDLFRQQFAAMDLPIDLHLACNGYQGLVMYGRLEPHLVITDLAMPEMDGFRMIAELSGLGVNEKAIIVITGLSNDEIASNGGLPKDMTVLSRPVEFEKLKKLLAQRLESRVRLP